jgi:hypothetical protein
MQSHRNTKLSRVTWHVKFRNAVTYTEIQNSPGLHDTWSSVMKPHTPKYKTLPSYMTSQVHWYNHTRPGANRIFIIQQRWLQTALSLLWSKVISFYRTGWCSSRDLELYEYSGGAWLQSWPRHLLFRGFPLFSSASLILFRDSTSIMPESLILNKFTIHQPSHHRRYAVRDTDIVIKQATETAANCVTWSSVFSERFISLDIVP